MKCITKHTLSLSRSLFKVKPTFLPMNPLYTKQLNLDEQTKLATLFICINRKILKNI